MKITKLIVVILVAVTIFGVALHVYLDRRAFEDGIHQKIAGSESVHSAIGKLLEFQVFRYVSVDKTASRDAYRLYSVSVRGTIADAQIELKLTSDGEIESLQIESVQPHPDRSE